MANSQEATVAEEGIDAEFLERVLGAILPDDLVAYVFRALEGDPTDEEPVRPITNAGYGRLYLGACRRREKHARRAGAVSINVTSGSRRADSLELSPMYLLTAEGHPFENDWQYRKVYEHLGHVKVDATGQTYLTEAFFRWREAGLERRVGPKQKGVRTPPEVSRIKKLYPQTWRPIGSLSDADELLGYIDARRELYFPLYESLIRDLPIIETIRDLLRSGQDVLLDVDAPPRARYPEGVLFNEATFQRFLADPSWPCGHGWGVCRVVMAGL